MSLFDKFFGALHVTAPVLTAVPPGRYQSDVSFVKQVRVALSDGSVSMGVGRMFTREDHDKLYASLKNYQFTE
ncbi:MAG: hypothetical protein KJ958_16285 [Gammaproteobacteria bacterium]|nr:hypothetical protein [Gammaproteobacteria bacterium]